MEQYISKSSLIGEIERRKKEEVNYDDDSKSFASYADQIYYSVLDSMQDFVNTLEVKYLQEEPVSKVWDDASERPDYNVGKDVLVGYKNDDDLYDEYNNVAYYITLSIFVSRKDLNTRVVRWAYLKDLI